jgi:hypothetical protein
MQHFLISQTICQNCSRISNLLCEVSIFSSNNNNNDNNHYITNDVCRNSSVRIAIRHGRTIRGSNPGGGKIFRTRTDRPWFPPSLMYKGYLVLFQGAEWQGPGFYDPSPSSAEVKERVELYLCTPSWSSWPLLGRSLPLYYH